MPKAKPLPADAPREAVWYLRSIPYSEYRQSNHWRIRRQAYHDSVIARYGELRCELCTLHDDGEPPPMRFNVHHRTYAHLGFEHDDDLILLCSPCHNLVHRPDSAAARHFLEAAYWAPEDLEELAAALNPDRALEQV